jgi:hypothetical protein
MDDPLIIGSQLSNLLGGTDSKMWIKLFIAADKINPDFAARLMYMRNSGCRLQKSNDFGYVIQPIKAFWDETFYKQEKMCLMPYREDLIRLLRGLS